MFSLILPNVLFLLHDPSQHTAPFSGMSISSHRISLDFFWLCLRLSLFHSLEGFCPSIDICLFFFFLIIRLRLYASGRKHTQINCHSHEILSREHTINMTYAVHVALGYLAEVYVSDFSM